MFELYGDMVEDNEPQTDQDATQTTDKTTQITTQTSQGTTQRTSDTTQSNPQIDQETAQSVVNLTQTEGPRTLSVQEQIIHELRKNPKLSRKDLSKIITSVTEDGIKYHLKKIQERGLLRRVGANFGGYWEILI